MDQRMYEYKRDQSLNDLVNNTAKKLNLTDPEKIEDLFKLIQDASRISPIYNEVGFRAVMVPLLVEMGKDPTNPEIKGLMGDNRVLPANVWKYVFQLDKAKEFFRKVNVPDPNKIGELIDKKLFKAKTKEEEIYDAYAQQFKTQILLEANMNIPPNPSPTNFGPGKG